MSRIPEHYTDHYVYKLCRPCGEPFYVGLGAVTNSRPVGFRAKAHIKEAETYLKYGSKKLGANLFKLRVINQIIQSGDEVITEIVSSGLSREEAVNLEVDLIRNIGRRDLLTGPLTNLTDGGEGGFNPAKSTRDKISAANRGRIASEETRQRQSEVRKGRVITPEWRAKISQWQKGRPHNDEWNAKVGEASRKSWQNPEYRARILKVHIKQWLVTFPDGHQEIRKGLASLIEEYPDLRMPSLSQSGKKGKPYKGFLAVKMADTPPE